MLRRLATWCRFGLFCGLLTASHVLRASPPAPTPLHIRVRPVAKDVFVHTSYHRYPGTVAPVASNGLIIKTKEGAVLIDTAWDPDQTLELLRWVADSLHQRVQLVVITHAHEDRMGGLAVLRANNIKVYSTPATAARITNMRQEAPKPVIKPFTLIRAGRTKLELFFPGPGHAPDNIVAWLPRQKLLFGGCLVKEKTAATLGNIDDANLVKWPSSVRTVAARYPNASVVVPGHGAPGGPELLARTLELLRAPGRKSQTALNGQP